MPLRMHRQLAVPPAPQVLQVPLSTSVHRALRPGPGWCQAAAVLGALLSVATVQAATPHAVPSGPVAASVGHAAAPVRQATALLPLPAELGATVATPPVVGSGAVVVALGSAVDAAVGPAASPSVARDPSASAGELVALDAAADGPLTDGLASVLLPAAPASGAAAHLPLAAMAVGGALVWMGWRRSRRAHAKPGLRVG